jgi:hypothetical protein
MGCKRDRGRQQGSQYRITRVVSVDRAGSKRPAGIDVMTWLPLKVTAANAVAPKKRLLESVNEVLDEISTDARRAHVANGRSSDRMPQKCAMNVRSLVSARNGSGGSDVMPCRSTVSRISRETSPSNSPVGIVSSRSNPAISAPHKQPHATAC